VVKAVAAVAIALAHVSLNNGNFRILKWRYCTI
jgi:hypothetical protein